MHRSTSAFLVRALSPRLPRWGVALLAATLAWPAAAATPAAAASAPAAAASAPLSASKRALLEKLLSLWHPEQVAIVMAQRPAAEAVQSSRIALQGRVSGERLDTTVKSIAADAQRYVDEVTPVAQAAGAKAAQEVALPMLAESFTEAELKELIALMESPVRRKFEGLVPKVEAAVGTRVATEAGPQIQPKLDAMKQEVASKLRAAAIVR